MDGKTGKQDRFGRPGERKKDDCSWSRGRFKVVSHELFGIAVISDHLSIMKPVVVSVKDFFLEIIKYIYFFFLIKSSEDLSM